MISMKDNVMSECLNWYAIYTKPRSEKKVEERLLRINCITFLPLMPSIRIWSDRKKKILVPLISSFVFVKSTEKEVYEILKVEGALRVIKHMGKPAKIQDFEINNLKILLNDPECILEYDNFDISAGEKIKVDKGPFNGLIGKCIKFQGKHRVVIEISTLGKIIEVNISKSFLSKLL